MLLLSHIKHLLKENNPLTNPDGDGHFRYRCVRYGWLRGKRVHGQAHWSRRQPHAFDCFGHFHYALRFVPSSTVQHLRFKAPCLTAGALAHPACSTGIGFRRVSSITILTLRKPVAHQRCSATPTVSLALTMTTLTWCLHSIPCAAQCSRFTQGCRCCKPLTHSCRCRHPVLPCYRSTAHRHRLSTTSSL